MGGGEEGSVKELRKEVDRRGGVVEGWRCRGGGREEGF